MKKLKIISTLSILFVTATIAQAQTGRAKVREGNKNYKEEQYADAEVSYAKALEENPNNYEGIFNLGDALYKQGRYEEAAEKFEIAAGQAQQKSTRSEAFYNMGNAFLKNHYNVKEPQAKMQQLQKSVEAYKQALRDRPDDMDAKYNLAYAKKLLKEQQQKQQNQKNKDNKDQNKKDKDKQDKDQQKKDEEKKKKEDQKKKDEQEKEEGKQDKKEQEKQKQQQQDKISREDAKRMLEALKNEEAELQKKLNKKKMKSQRIVIEKDW